MLCRARNLPGTWEVWRGVWAPVSTVIITPVPGTLLLLNFSDCVERALCVGTPLQQTLKGTVRFSFTLCKKSW